MTIRCDWLVRFITCAMPTLMPCNVPNRKNAVTMDKHVSSVRTGLRRSAAPSSGPRFIARQRALVHMQHASGIRGRARIVSDDDDGLALLLIQNGQQLQD